MYAYFPYIVIHNLVYRIKEFFEHSKVLPYSILAREELVGRQAVMLASDRKATGMALTTEGPPLNLERWFTLIPDGGSCIGTSTFMIT